MATNDFSKNLEILTTDLGKKIQQLHSREEYDQLSVRLKNAIGTNDQYGNRKKYDAKVQVIYTSIVNLLVSVFPELAYDDFPVRLSEGNQKIISERFNDYANRLVRQSEVDNQFAEELYKIHSEYKSSKDYIRRVVLTRLAKISPEFVCAPGSSELRSDIDSISTDLLILKQFIKQFGWCENVKGDDHGRGFECLRLKGLIGERSFESYAKGITEDIFDVLAEHPNDNGSLSREENNLRIVNFAKNLGKGYFQRNTDNREPLYVFAIAFEMTLAFGNRIPEAGDPDYETDIRKNLFFDFYTDNLINSLNSSGTENDISGYGVNYKNFREVAFLRSIKSPKSALDKLREAMFIIDFCEKDSRAKSLEQFDDADDVDADIGEKVSFGFSDIFLSDFIVHLSDDVDSFCDFLLDNYVCKDIEKAYRYGSDLRTAMEVYQKFTSDDVREQIIQISSSNTGAWGNSIKIKINTDDSSQEREKKTAFNKLLSHFSVLKNHEQHLLEYSSGVDVDEHPENLNDIDKVKKYDEVRDKHGRSKIIRSDLVIAIMNFLVVSYVNNRKFIPDESLINFGNFYGYVARNYNADLIRSGFMEINAKSIFDLLAVYSTYQQLISLLHVYQFEGRT